MYPRFLLLTLKLMTLSDVSAPKNSPECICGAPDPAGGAYNAPPDPLVGWGGDTPCVDCSMKGCKEFSRLVLMLNFLFDLV